MFTRAVLYWACACAQFALLGLICLFVLCFATSYKFALFALFVRALVRKCSAVPYCAVLSLLCYASLSVFVLFVRALVQKCRAVLCFALLCCALSVCFVCSCSGAMLT